MAALPQWNLVSIGLTKRVHPYWRLAIATIATMPTTSWTHRPLVDARGSPRTPEECVPSTSRLRRQAVADQHRQRGTPTLKSRQIRSSARSVHRLGPPGTGQPTLSQPSTQPLPKPVTAFPSSVDGPRAGLLGSAYTWMQPHPPFCKPISQQGHERHDGQDERSVDNTLGHGTARATL